MSQRVQHIRGTTAEVESVTPLAAELGFDTTKKEPHIGDGATPGGIRLAKKNAVETLAPAQITADVADYNPAGVKHAGALILTSDAARDLTGLVPSTVVATTDGREITLYNSGGNNITLKHESGASGAANRFDLGGADIVLSPKASATLRYRDAAARWELVAQTAGAAVAAGGVIARTLAASSQGFSLINGVVAASVGAGALTVAVKTLAGNDPSAADPVHVLLRNATLTSGDYTLHSLAAATSLVVSSGSSLGATNGVPFTLRLVGLDDAGTFRLGLINLGREGAALPLLRTDRLVSSTAEGGAGGADSANVLYAGAAIANGPFALLADLDWSAGLTAAGTWDALPTQIQPYDPRMDLPGYGMPAIARKRTGLFGARIVESRAGNAVTFAVKTMAGEDPSAINPVYATFLDAAGGMVVRTITSALSLTISSGSTLGAANGVPFRVWLLAIDSGAGVVLGAVKASDVNGVMALHEAMPISTTAEGGAGGADLAKTVYTVAAQAAKPFAVVGFADYDGGLAAAGTWSVAPTAIRLVMPGAPRPGDVVQEVVGTTSAAFVTSSQTYQSSSLTATIKLTSPQNLVAADARYTNRVDTSGVECLCRIHRDTVEVGVSTDIYSSTGSVLVLGQAASAYDFPGATGPHQYILKIKSSSSGNSVQVVSTPQMMTLKEIMG